MGPYAWQKPISDQSPYVGICIATSTDGLETEEGIKISTALEAAFDEWTGMFEQFAERPGFDWMLFHEQGMSLSRRLNTELGQDYRVMYHKPYEDPGREANEYLEIKAQ